MIPEENVSQTFYQQIETIFAFLQRPTVQAQLVTLIIVVLLGYGTAWLISRLVERWLRRTNNVTSTRYQVHTARYLLPSLMVVLFAQVAASLVSNLINATGLIVTGRNLFIIILVYFSVLVLLYIVVGDKRVRPYHRRITLPLLILFIARLVAGSIFDLNALSNVTLVNVFETPITLGRVAIFILILYFFGILAQMTRSVLDVTLIPRFGMDQGAAGAIQSITRYLVIGIGVLASLSVLGFDFSTLAVVFGGLSIGIGLGLQQIVSNFFSGILLLFEQSLRPGDIISVNGVLGTVQQLSIRATTVRTFENVDLVIPNEYFLTNAIENYTKFNAVIRGDIHVGVSYDADPVEVRRLLLDVVKVHGQILDNPEPMVFFTNFGTSSLDFWVLFWVEGVRTRLPVATDLRMMIWRSFKKNGISIPYPQQDLYVKQWPDTTRQPPDEVDEQHE